jgi:hypothetical protein
MNQIEYDPSEKGLRAILKDYQEIALRAIWARAGSIHF